MTNVGVASAMKVFRGRGIGQKNVIGRLKFGEIRRQNELISDCERSKMVLFRAAELGRHELEDMKIRAAESVGDEHAEIFSLYLKIVDEGVLLRTAERLIERAVESGEPYPVRRALTLAPERLADGDTSLLIHSKRTADVILGCVELAESELEKAKGGSKLSGGEEDGKEQRERYILVCDDADVDGAFERGEILGVVCAEGADVARRSEELGIPVICVSELPNGELDGKTAILDPISGRLTVSPDLAALDGFSARVKENESVAARRSLLVGKKSVTRSGKRLSVTAAISDLFELKSAIESDAEGIGCFNTDFMLKSGGSVDEESQFLIYRQVAEAFSGGSAIRCFSICGCGAERQGNLLFPTLPNQYKTGGSGESFSHFSATPRDILKTQIRACMRAAAYGKMGVIVPDIISAEGARRVKTIINEAKNELKYECLPFSEELSFGIEIGTPAAAVMSDVLSREADFFIIDLDALSVVCPHENTKNATQNATQAKRKKVSVEAAFRFAEIAAHGISSNQALRRRVSLSDSFNATQNAAHFKGKFGVLGQLSKNPSAIENILSLGASFIALPPPYVLEAREIIRGLE